MKDLEVDVTDSTEARPAIGEEAFQEKLDVENSHVGDATDSSDVGADGAAASILEIPLDHTSASTSEINADGSAAISDAPFEQSPAFTLASYEQVVLEVGAELTIETNEKVAPEFSGPEASSGMTKENVAPPELSEAKSPIGATGKENETLVVGKSISEEEEEAETKCSAERRNRVDSFDLKSIMEPEEGNTADGGRVPKEASRYGTPTKEKDRRMLTKAKSSDKMKKVKATPRSPVCSPPVTPKKPLMDLRHILKKHEKKTETQQIHQSEGHVDFYGSMSSIPFLKANKQEKDPEKKKKGKRVVKEKRSKQVGVEESPPDVDGKTKKISIVTEARDGQKRTTEVTIISDYDQDDLSMWKSMSVVDGSFMEEVSDRPRDMLPLVPIPSPKKEEEKPSPQHNQRGFQRPDDWVEFGHPNKRSPVKVTYKAKAVRDAIVIDAPSVFSDSDMIQTAESTVKPKSTPAQISHDEKVLAKCHAESVSRKSSTLQESAGSPPSRTAVGSLKTSSPSTAKPKASLKETQTNPPASPSIKKSPGKRESRKVYQATELAIQFHDGCVVHGQFRPKESVQRVIQDLKRDVLRNDMPLPSFDLCVQSDEGTKILDPAMILEDLNLVPSGKVYVTWTKPMDSTMKPGWYLLDEDDAVASK
jgi:hypothetical protein